MGVHTLKIPFSWAERRPVLLDQFLYIPPVYWRHEEWRPIPWAEIFGNSRPVFVEYCSGNGQWIGEQALRNPGANWVAVEKRFDRARQCWKLLKREKIPNLIVVCGEGELFTRCYAPARGFTGGYVNFPDPWPKRCHQERRLLKGAFLELVEGAMAPGSFLTCVTDDEPYCRAMLELFAERRRWKSFFPQPHFVTEWPDFGDSFFKTLWQSKGLQIFYQRYQLCID